MKAFTTSSCALVTTLAFALPGVPAGAAPTCLGQEATIVADENGGPLEGTTGPDVIVGSKRIDQIDAKGGDDLVCSGADPDTVVAGDGDDRVAGGNNLDTINGGEGADFLRGDETLDFIDGGPGPDRIFGGARDDSLRGGEGNDILTGGPGQDRFYGEPGDDLYRSKAGSGRLLYGGPFVGDIPEGPVSVDLPARTATGPGIGSDTLRGTFKRIIGTEESDSFTGFFRNEAIYGGAGDDDIKAGGGNDIVSGQGGDDVLRGGEGERDLVTFEGSPGPVMVNLVTGDATGSGSDDIGGFEDVWGSIVYDNVFVGDDASNRFRIGHGVDDVSAAGGEDEVFSYLVTGNDKAFQSDDTLDGGTGEDLLQLRAVLKPVEIDLAAQIATSEGVTASLIDFENVDARNTVFEVLGPSPGNVLLGDDEDNELLSWGADDVLEGRGGNDYLEGGYRDDDLDGGEGTDELDGGSHEDECTNGEAVVNCEDP